MLWRRGRDSNPREAGSPYAISSRARSSTPAPLHSEGRSAIIPSPICLVHLLAASAGQHGAATGVASTLGVRSSHPPLDLRHKWDFTCIDNLYTRCCDLAGVESNPDKRAADCHAASRFLHGIFPAGRRLYLSPFLVYAILPHALSHFITYLLYRWEVVIPARVVDGIVIGVGWLSGWLRKLARFTQGVPFKPRRAGVIAGRTKATVGIAPAP